MKIKAMAKMQQQQQMQVTTPGYSYRRNKA
jgi:hypothetical protein